MFRTILCRYKRTFAAHISWLLVTSPWETNFKVIFVIAESYTLFRNKYLNQGILGRMKEIPERLSNQVHRTPGLHLKDFWTKLGGLMGWTRSKFTPCTAVNYQTNFKEYLRQSKRFQGLQPVNLLSTSKNFQRKTAYKARGLRSENLLRHRLNIFLKLVPESHFWRMPENQMTLVLDLSGCFKNVTKFSRISTRFWMLREIS